MNQEYNQKLTIWDKLCEGLSRGNEVKVDNERIEKLLKGGFLFGFTISDLFIMLSAILTLIFLQLQPYLIPYLEGSLGKPKLTLEVGVFEQGQSIKTSSPSAKIKTSSPSANTNKNELTSTSSSQLELEKELSKEKIYCQSPRPEICTMECMVNPPYICGSDGKSYCSTCQACTNSNIEWYILQDEPCLE